MTDRPTTAGHRPADGASVPRNRAANTRPRPRRHHPAQGARIAAVGIGTTTMAGLVGFMGYAQPPSTAPTPPTQVAVVTNPGGTIDRFTTTDTTGTGATATATVTATSTATSRDSTTLTARPTVTQALPADQTPTASTSGSN